jgi:prepilin-type N-terminal cleavage/methylation domain-containing protein
MDTEMQPPRDPMKIARPTTRSGLLQLLRRDDGFSLMELLVAMVLLVVVLGAIYTIWFGLQRTYSYTDDDMRAQQEARTALNELVEYIRTARLPGNPPSEALAMVIVSADDNSLVCWTDIDRDENHTLELVRFRVDTENRTLYRDTNTTGDINFDAGTTSVRMVGSWVSNDEDQPLFEYRTAGNEPAMVTPVEDPTIIREITINLRIDIVTDQRPVTHQLRSIVQPRNLRQ